MAYQTKVIDGKVEIPVSALRELGLREGDKLMVDVEAGRATISRDRFELLQKALDELHPWGVSAADDLIAERRAEGYLSKEEFRDWLIERFRMP